MPPMADPPPRDLGAVLAEFATLLAEEHGPQEIFQRLGNYCTELLPVHGIGVLLRTADNGIEVATSNTEAGRIVEELEVELGEGPCTESVITGRQIVVPDLQAVADRYPRFVPRALEANVRSIHALPMSLRGEHVGSMDIVATEVTHLSPDQLTTAQVLADVALTYVANSRLMESQTKLAGQLQTALDSRIIIEQAKGVMAERHGLTVTDAFERLRRHARNNQLKLHDVATQVVNGELEL